MGEPDYLDGLDEIRKWRKKPEADAESETGAKRETDDDLLGGLDEIRKWRKKPEKKPEAEAEAKEVDIDKEVDDIKQQRAALAKKREAEAAAKAEAEAKAEADEPRIYVVKSGDSLSKIAKEVYGNAGRWKEIYEANKDQIKDPNLIYRGQKLRIP
jgi:nucleoid-associated protein YgaU